MKTLHATLTHELTIAGLLLGGWIGMSIYLQMAVQTLASL